MKNSLLETINSARVVAELYRPIYVEDQLIEEMAELTQAIIKFRRATGNGCHTPTLPEDAMEDLMEEMSDVIVCLSQVSWFFTDVQRKTIIMIARDKINRQLERYYSDGEN